MTQMPRALLSPPHSSPFRDANPSHGYPQNFINSNNYYLYTKKEGRENMKWVSYLNKQSDDMWRWQSA